MSRRSRAIDEAYQHIRKLLAAGRLQDAAQACQQLLAGAPTHADTMSLLAMVALRLGQPQTATDWLNRAMQQKPASAAGYMVNCALTLLELGHPEPALEASQGALARKPDFPEALQAAGHALADLGRAEEAVKMYRQALRQKPALHDIQNNLALALRALSRLEEAEPWFRQAAAREPGDPILRANHASLLKDLGRLEAAEAEYRAALKMAPAGGPVHAMLQYNLGILLLLAGRLAEGWEGYEHRFAAGAVPPRPYSQPRWNGENLDGRSLLIHAEQGFGDTIQMARYLSEIAQRAGTQAGRVLLQVPRPLVRLLSGFPAVQVFETGDELPAFDLQCPIMSLPRAFATTLETIPAKIPYLRADPVRTAHWRRRTADLPGLRVGIVWAGNPRDPTMDRRRSIPLDLMAPLAGMAGVSLVSLQKDVPPGGLETSAIGRALQDWTGELQDFAETACLIEALDLIIGVDTAVVHLAGALGRPVWLLNRADTDWRWLLGRGDNPWYRTLRQFRQPHAGDWASVVLAAKNALMQLRDEAGTALP
jgi:tetratricopeptide (TPR) repeat protein